MKKKGADPRDFDLRGVDRALRRAARTAKELAVRTRTPFFVFEDGKVVDAMKRGKKAG